MDVGAGLSDGWDEEGEGVGWVDSGDSVGAAGVEVARVNLEGWGLASGGGAGRDCEWRAAGGTLKGERRSYS